MGQRLFDHGINKICQIIRFCYMVEGSVDR